MFRIIIFSFSIIFSLNAHSFQCARDHSDDSVFKESLAVYLVRINSVEFYKDIEGGEFAKLLLTKYEVHETLKGIPQKEGVVTDLAGIGTGFVGFIPGAYYIIAIGEQPLGTDVNHITFCGILGSAFHLDDEELKEKTIKLRALSENS